MDKETVLHHYLHAALWTAELDNSDIENITERSIEQAKKDIEAFLKEAEPLLQQYKQEINPEQMGHDFWLTRNRHGAGFWDRNLGELGDKLTELSKKFKELNVFSDTGEVVDIE